MKKPLKTELIEHAIRKWTCPKCKRMMLLPDEQEIRADERKKMKKKFERKFVPVTDDEGDTFLYFRSDNWGKFWGD